MEIKGTTWKQRRSQMTVSTGHDRGIGARLIRVVPAVAMVLLFAVPASAQDWPPCSEWRDGRCLSCRSLGKWCVDGRCFHKPPPCPPCSERRGERCVSCKDLGKWCVKGECRLKLPPCPPCSERRGDRCLSCKDLGKMCKDGKCR